jgi:hypothetical protein
VDLHEALLIEIGTEEIADTRLDAEDGLGGTSSKVDNTIIETYSLRE